VKPNYEKVKQIRMALKLILRSNLLAEIRVKNTDGSWLEGLFDDLDEAARAVVEEGRKATGVFVMLNKPDPSLAGQANNILGRATLGVKDKDIKRLQWILVDVDPMRAPDTPSSDEEHDAALAMAGECRGWLRDLGWPEPVLANSGNGAHLLYGVDLPSDESGRDLFRNCLEVLALKFSDSQAQVDCGNFNPSRLVRLYGTANRKGTRTDERPYGYSELLEVPQEITNVPLTKLQELASMAPIGVTGCQDGKFDVAGWIQQHGVVVRSQGSWKRTGYRWGLDCPWNEAHHRSAYVVQFPDGGVAAGCLHKSCTGKTWPDLRARYDLAMSSQGQDECTPAAQQRSQTARLLEFSEGLTLFKTPQDEGYATVVVGGHRENHRLDTKALKHYLRFRYYERTGTAPRPQAVQEAVQHLDAVARFGSPELDVFTRVAKSGEANFLDLCNGEWQAIAFDGEGWRIVDATDARFCRLRGMLPLPVPVKGGKIGELRSFLNLRNQDDWVLFVTALLGALFSRGPYPVLAFHGEAGSAKTTSARIFRAMIDPNASPSRAIPKDLRDLMIAAQNQWILSFDNLSYLPPWFSDALCRLSTGGGFATRELYTNSDEILFEGQRPIVLNGIEELASRTDLLDRSILLDLPAIKNFKEEAKFWEDFSQAQPRLLGALLDVAVTALGNLPSVHPDDSPRMADFAALATAAEPALGLMPGAFIGMYAGNRNGASAVALEASPISDLIMDLVEERPFAGTATQLLTRLTAGADDRHRSQRGWPKNAKVLSGMIRRLTTALKNTGIEVDLYRKEDRKRTRMISIRKEKPTAELPPRVTRRPSSTPQPSTRKKKKAKRGAS